MAIHKPNMSAEEARRLANARSAGLPLPPPAPKAPAEPVVPLEPKIAGKPAASATLPQEASPAARVAVQAPAQSPEIPTQPSPALPPAREATDVPRPPVRTFVDTRHDKVQVFLSAPLPRQGVSATFERLCLQYPAQKALQMILRKALDDYEAMLKDGSYQRASETYETEESDAALAGIQTSRMIPKALLAVAQEHFDPLGLESARSFGRKVATAALAAFFVHEKKRRR